MRQYALGIDLGGTGTKFGLVDEDGQVLRSDSIPTQQYPDIVEYCDVLCAGLKRLVEAEGLTMGDLAGIGCGAPDANFYTGCIEQATNLPWKGVMPLAKLISERMGVKCIVTNDANAAAQGEMIYGSARGMKNFIVITLGTGVGSGIVTDGKLLYGHDGFAGELGHCKVDYSGNGRLCGCGQRGCIEAYASATGVARSAKEIIENSTKETSLRKLENITSYDVFKAAEAGDEVAKEIFDFTGEMLGKKLADFVAFSAPEAIILFGGLTNSGHWIMDPIEKALNDNVMHLWKGKVKLLVSTLKDSDAAILGASSLAWDIAAQAPMKN